MPPLQAFLEGSEASIQSQQKDILILKPTERYFDPRPPHIEVSFAEMRRALHEQPTESERAQEARQKEVHLVKTLLPISTL